ncbi:MAG: LL-diaminopimelate aminotransferase [Clostridia bacterium]|nr:LL-diaminopimelate aminotransferase [Clostridia bacterium]
MKINANYLSLSESYLFTEIAHRVAAYSKANPDADIIKLGIGDVTRPLAPVVVEAMKAAAAEMGQAQTFHGYGPEQGYGFLRDAVRDYYGSFGVTLQSDEIFISDGAKSDLGNILELFSKDNTVLVPDPVYPVYVDTNVMDGRPVQFMKGTEENGFCPLPKEGVKADLIYLCSPNNPTGAVYTREQLQQWVNYALEQDAVILFDAAYESFIGDASLPHSIFEIPGARRCAIEFCSLSKTAGFTGTRCGYTVVPQELEREGVQLKKFWLRRQTTKFNGTSYVVQRAAQAVFTPEGLKQCRENVRYYKENAQIIAGVLGQLHIFFTGGEHSPYIWMKCPRGMGSWEFFDFLLDKAHVVGTPGAGFGGQGEGFFRLTGFGDREKTKEAARRLLDVLG